MRVLVTGRTGQVVTSLLELAGHSGRAEIVALGRPALDLASPQDLETKIGNVRPDVVVNAAAYTAVDQAEQEPDLAMAVNGQGAGAVAAAASSLQLPLIQISTDYVFDGGKDSPYHESDPVAPAGSYGRSKLAGELAAASFCPNHAILRTSWVYAARGRNFVRTMLRLAAASSEVSVVCDQLGSPSYAPDLADGILAIARNLVAHPDRIELRGVFHMSGGGETDWASFAEAIFAASAKRGGPSARVKRIRTAEFPSAARRPANSRLDCGKIAALHGVALPHWRDALERAIDRILAEQQ